MSSNTPEIPPTILDEDEDSDIWQKISDQPNMNAFTGQQTVSRQPPPPTPPRESKPAPTKQSVTIKLDTDLIDALKSLDPKNWQARLNAIARNSLGM